MHRSEILSSIGCETCSMWTRCGQDICVDPVQFSRCFFFIPKIFWVVLEREIFVGIFSIVGGPYTHIVGKFYRDHSPCSADCKGISPNISERFKFGNYIPSRELTYPPKMAF